MTVFLTFLILLDILKEEREKWPFNIEQKIQKFKRACQ